MSADPTFLSPPTAGIPAGLPARRELLLGGQKSGKSRQAESRAADWLQVPAGVGAEGGARREAWLIATALPADAEMAARIERHRVDRLARVPRLRTLEVPDALAAAIDEHSVPVRLLVVDCLTLWLTQVALPPGQPPAPVPQVERRCGELLAAVRRARGPLVLVSNEIGLGLTPMTPEARRCVDQLGRLHQDLAQLCEAVTLLVAGLPVAVKAPRPLPATAGAAP